MDNLDWSQLVALISQYTSTDGAYQTAIPALRLYRTSVRTPLQPFIYEPALCIVAQGAKEVLFGGQSYQHDPACSLLVSVDIPVSARVVQASAECPCLMIRITLDPAMVADLVAEGVTLEDSNTQSPGLTTIQLSPQLLNAVNRLVGLLNSEQDVRVLAPLILREITYRVLIGTGGAKLRQLCTAAAPAHQIARSIRWLRTHFAEPFQSHRLARLAQMSVAGFYRHFKAVTGLSPLQFQKQLRLQEARRLMLSEGLDAATAAFRVGYESPSQFSREYRRLFGLSPRRDVFALRTTSLPSSL